MSAQLNDSLPFTTAMARDMGWSRRTLDQAIREGRIRRVVRGVYVDAGVPDSRAQRLASVHLVAPDHAVACSETAAWILGVDAFKPSEQFLLTPSFLVPHSTSRVRTPHVRCRQANIEDVDVTVTSGVAHTTPLRTTSDLLRRLYRPFALAAADGMAHVGLIDVDELRDFVAALKGYPGIVQARSLSHLVEPLAQSPGESWQRLRIVDAGFPRPEAQLEVVDHLGGVHYLDHGYSRIKVGAEFDGRLHHTAEADVLHDRGRRLILTDVLDWRLVVSRREDIFGVSTEFEDRLGELLGMRPLPRRWGYGA